MGIAGICFDADEALLYLIRLCFVCNFEYMVTFVSFIAIVRIPRPRLGDATALFKLVDGDASSERSSQEDRCACSSCRSSR